MIERTEPMAVAKGLVIATIKLDPKAAAEMFPDWNGTSAELIASLEADPRQWWYGGEFLTDAELKERRKAK